MREIAVLSASGQVGSGFSEKSFRRGLEMSPDVIGCDSGSCDSGPYCLGAGVANKSKAAVKRDLRLMILGGLEKKIPVLIGSAGTSGGKPHLAWTSAIIREIAQEEDLNFRLATVEAELSGEQLKSYMRAGKVKPLHPAPDLDEKTVDGMTRIVGMMGAEPFITALQGGAQVVLTGRASDTSIFAAVPMMHGYDNGPAWHAAKLLECGAACVEYRAHPDCMMAWIREDSFSIEAPNPEMRVTPVSCVSHSFYETANPFDLVEPGGTIKIKDCNYIAENERRVRVTGSRFEKAAQYTIRLEGARFAGYRQIVIGSIRDPLILRQIDAFVGGARESVIRKAAESIGLTENQQYRIQFRVYGKSRKYTPDEVCVLIEVVADTPEHAKEVCAIAWHTTLHHPIPEWSGLQSQLAFPFSPPAIEAGVAYSFCLNHVVEVDDPLELFPIAYHDL